MFKVVKAAFVLFAILGIVAVFAIGTKACKELMSYKDNLSSYTTVLEAMSDDNEETIDTYVAAIIA